MKKQIVVLLLTACNEQNESEETKESTTDNNGSITFTNIERSQLEEYYDSDYLVFQFYVEEKSGLSRKEIYDNFLGRKFDRDSYLGGGLVVGRAKDILDLKVVQGLDIVMTEFFYENYFIDKEYIEKIEADKDNVLVHLDGIKPSEADIILDNYDVEYVIEDYIYDDINTEFMRVNVNKEKLQELYENDVVIGMRKRIYIELNQQFASIKWLC